jgi:hypothetical protein
MRIVIALVVLLACSNAKFAVWKTTNKLTSQSVLWYNQLGAASALTLYTTDNTTPFAWRLCKSGGNDFVIFSNATGIFSLRVAYRAQPTLIFTIPGGTLPSVELEC